MAIRALKCPSCGADITLDDDREYGFCSYCGTQIQLGEQINVHVTHEFKGNSPDIHVTNQYYYNKDASPDNHANPVPVVERPKGKKAGWGIALAIIGIIGLFTSGGKGFTYVLVCLIMIAISVFLLVSYCRDMKLYRDTISTISRNRKKE